MAKFIHDVTPRVFFLCAMILFFISSSADTALAYRYGDAGAIRNESEILIDLKIL